MKKKHGMCALCKKETDLTFEHIPPRAAFNSKPSRPIKVADLIKHKEMMPWETDGLKYENLQQGMGYSCLCQSCNNLTGTWYGDSYVKFAQAAAYVVKASPEIRKNSVEFLDIYPLRVIKQIVSMFCSINPPDRFDLDDLRKFVINKQETGIDATKYRLCMCLST